MGKFAESISMFGVIGGDDEDGVEDGDGDANEGMDVGVDSDVVGDGKAILSEICNADNRAN